MLGKNKSIDLPRIDLINNLSHFGDLRPNLNIGYFDNFYNCLNESIYKHAINGKLSIQIKPRIYGVIYYMRDYNEDLIKILDWTEENCDEHYLDVVDVICTRSEPTTDSSDIIAKGVVNFINNSKLRID